MSVLKERQVTEMKKGDLLTLEISAMNSEGGGIARHGKEGFVVFVPGVLEGERAKCRIVRVGKNYAVAEALDLYDPSRERAVPRCSLYYKCGGCQLQHAAYPLQLKIKARILSDAMRKIAKMDVPGEISCMPSPETWGYRNKTTLPVQRPAKEGGKSLVCGYYERRSHRVVPFRECPVLNPRLEALTRSVVRMTADAGFSGYDERSGTGDIRHLAFRCGGWDGVVQMLAGTVAAREFDKRAFGRLKNIHQKLGTDHPELVGSVMNINTAPGNFIWGPLFRPLCGGKLIDQQLGGNRFRMDISAFFQINKPQTEMMFDHIRAMVAAASSRALLELYSGIGSLTAYLAGVTERIDAVEEWRPAVRQLQENMMLNGIGNVQEFGESAERFMEDETRAAPGRYDTIVLDPPRTGCDARVTAGIRRVAPDRVVYVSCNPATLARDVACLCADGLYEVEDIRAFDMFPQTAHVESVTVLRKGKKR